MLKDLMMFASVAGVGYTWLCATVAPLVTSARSCLREHASRRALAGFGLACAAAVLWTIVPTVIALVGMMLEPRASLALLQLQLVGPGLAVGLSVWLLHFAVEQRLPRIGPTFEAATAIAIVAAVKDDDRTLAKVEGLYRAVATDGSRNVNTAPPPDAFETCTVPPWRSTMARTIDSPRPLPDGSRVPERDLSAL
jgi:hypothetical protein